MLSAKSPAGVSVRVGLAVLGGWVTWANHQLTPLIWVFLALFAADLLLNLHDEAVALQKLLKGLLAAGVPVVLQLLGTQTTTPLLYLRAGVAIAVAVELSTVAPVIVARLSSLVPPKDQAAVDAALEAELARLKAENDLLLHSLNATKGGQDHANPPSTPAQ